MQSAQSAQRKVAYVLGRFPALTMTFIDREILEARRAGTPLVLISIRASAPFEMRPEVKELARETRYLVPMPWLLLLRGALRFGLTRPWRMLGTLLYLVSRRHGRLVERIKTIGHFCGGVVTAEMLRKEDVNHVHAHFADRASVVAMTAARLLDTTYSLTAHANDIYISPVMLDEKIKNAKFATTCTAYNKAHLERVTGHPVELIYHGLDLAQLREEGSPVSQEAKVDRPPLLLSVGQLKEKKGFPVLLEACARLRDQGYDFRCEIVGEGPDRASLEALIDQYKLNGIASLQGALPNRVVMEKYRDATLFTLPCVVAKNDDRDGIPNVMLEAMAHQLPVVSTPVSGIPEVVEDEVTGLLVESGNAEQLAVAFARILDDPELRAMLGENGQQLVEERFDIHRNIGRLVELLHS